VTKPSLAMHKPHREFILGRETPAKNKSFSESGHMVGLAIQICNENYDEGCRGRLARFRIVGHK
jgi:hypothetical protein